MLSETYLLDITIVSLYYHYYCGHYLSSTWPWTVSTTLYLTLPRFWTTMEITWKETPKKTAPRSSLSHYMQFVNYNLMICKLSRHQLCSHEKMARIASPAKVIGRPKCALYARKTAPGTWNCSAAKRARQINLSHVVTLPRCDTPIVNTHLHTPLCLYTPSAKFPCMSYGD